MEMGLCFFAALLFVIVLICGGKILRMRRSAREIAAAFADRLSTETNTLIDISSHDRYMCSLAADINTQLRHPPTVAQLFSRHIHASEFIVSKKRHDK